MYAYMHTSWEVDAFEVGFSLGVCYKSEDPSNIFNGVYQEKYECPLRRGDLTITLWNIPTHPNL